MNRLLAALCALIIRAVGASLRMKIEDCGGILDQPDHPPVIIAFWHNQTALMAYFYHHYCRGRTAMTFISRSRDGQFMTDVAAQLGIRAVRGSTSRSGTAAALAAVHAASNPRVDLVITPDGPRGPRHRIQPGLLRLAQMTGRPIVTVSYRLDWKRELRSWDRFHVPLPFSRCHLVTSPPVKVPPAATDAELATVTDLLDAQLAGDRVDEAVEASAAK